MKLKIFIFVILFMLSGCMGTGDNKDIMREPDFQGLNSTVDDEKMVFVYVDDDRNQREKQQNARTEYVYAYWLKITDDTIIVNEEDEEVAIDETFLKHVEAWVKEEFQEERTEVNIHDVSLDKESIFPVYTADKIKRVEVERTKKDVLEKLKSYEEGKFTLHLFIDDVNKQYEMRDEINEVTDLISDIEVIETGSVRLGPPEDAKLLDIDEYPVYIVLDTEDIVLTTHQLDGVKEFFNVKE
ncbi:hypothetical protein [Desertibacillus haloalkaliphilus]|uniref:hypothetical protein n=1 Tax=Desertibacillus haloalkaliphilus TaxID=1328930 RepID=UPI001C25867C|nr:hypothetical protein [Desertibacillus haloalkaliphilus]MBU8907484.1 hypothetical protein [Desertibacillus haloalkaliphilus]